jgi:hypothetical protein
MTGASYPYTSGTTGVPGTCNYNPPLSPGVGSANLLTSPITDSKMESALAINSLSVQMKSGGTDF